MNSENKNCQNCKQDFIIEPVDFEFYEKMSVSALGGKVPPPTFCPDCRLQRRLAWRNERSLYRRKCDLCGANTVSMYHENGGIVNYCGPCHWSDKWDPLSYGMAYDFNKPFFDQFYELLHKVPQANLISHYQTLINSDYNNMNHALKNCYLLFNSDYDEDCYYGEEVENSKDSIDATMIDSSQFVYESVNVLKSYKVYYSVDIENSQNIWFSKNLANCSDCFCSVNLKNKQFNIFNEQYSKEEYFKKIESFNLGSRESVYNLKKEALNFWQKFPAKFMHGRSNTNVSGDYVYNSKNTKNVYIATESENCKHSMWLIVKNNKDCYDYTQFGENASLVYESQCVGHNINNIIGCNNLTDGRNIYYSKECWNNCADIFGCIGLKKKQFCILNKQYTESEYKELLPKIVSHMNDIPYRDKKDREYRFGDFLPIELSPFAYNETSAQEYFPISSEGAVEAGYNWREKDEKNYNITVKTEDIPDNIKDASDEMVKEIIACEHGGKCGDGCATAFKILPYEMKFYKNHNIPLPKLCSNCRHTERIKLRNPLKLWVQKCDCKGREAGIYQNTASHTHGENSCPNEFETTYSPDKKEIVYCEECYRAEIY